MQTISRGLLLLIIVFGLGLSFADAPKEPGVVHVVMVWLKDAGNPEHRQQIIVGSKQLRDIPGVQELHVGEVLPSDREVVESSYDVALSMRFASEEDLQAYLVHPIHKSTVKDIFMPIMDRFRVIDFRDQ